MNDNDLENFRTRCGRLSSVYVVDVNRDNINAVWPYLLISIKEASLIALDLELSGLGIQKGWNARSIEDRYEVIRKAAQTRSVLSLGISTFKFRGLTDKECKKRIKYNCKVFNILTLCSSPFMVEPDGLAFLSKHNFNFNQLITKGISYGKAVKHETADPMKLLWKEILSASAPVAFHNGLIDLAFIYEHFYSPLPDTLAEFVSTLTDWFTFTDQNGDLLIPRLYDSKYLAEYCYRMNASFLEYIFRKCQRDNAVEQSLSRTYVSIVFDDYTIISKILADSTQHIPCRLPQHYYQANVSTCVPPPLLIDRLCGHYASFGFCKCGNDCTLLHNVDLALDVEELKQEKIRTRRKRRYHSMGSDNTDGESFNSSFSEMKCSAEKMNGSNNSVDEKERKEKYEYRLDLNMSSIGCHRAGIDSFMTGFAVLFMCRMDVLRNRKLRHQFGNRLPLVGKSYPLELRKYLFSRQTMKSPNAECQDKDEDVNVNEPFEFLPPSS